ncbi:MAG: CHASE domain-containing protein [Deltaproteobacteria bacterium]|nr:CHASE domain-containing protein [Deltaproteobacteria bacterium]
MSSRATLVRRSVPWLGAGSVLALGLTITALGYGWLRSRERERVAVEVSHRVSGIANEIDQRFGGPVESMRAIAALISATGAADPRAFEEFSRDAIRREPHIYALEWAPRVTRDERAGFEAAARAQIPGYEIRDPSPTGLTRAGERDLYYPLRYLVPMNDAWGLDIVDRKAGTAVADRACQVGHAVASTRYHLVEDPPDVYAVYAVEPVWAHGVGRDDAASRCDTVLGYVPLLFRINPLMADLQRRVELDDLELAVRDVTGATGGASAAVVMVESSPGASARITGPMAATQLLSFVDRTWEVALAPRTAPSGPTWFLVAGALGSLFGAALFGGGMAWRRLRQRYSQVLRLGQYHLEEEIGRGGMGVVYRARHVMLRRDTALKLLAAPPDDDQALARFEREVQLTAELSHPNTIAIYDYGRTPDGRFYYAMEYIDGLTFDELIEHDSEQPVSRTIHMVRQVAFALREAHAAGMVHRDLKPGNLMLSMRGGMVDWVKVLDFGLVKRVGHVAMDGGGAPVVRARGSGQAPTEIGIITGTPGYIAPEMLRSRDVDHRADIYALGAIWYALLAGRAPFLGGTMEDTLQAQIRHRPAPLDRLRGDLPDGLVALIMRCMNPDPQARVVSAQALVDELDSIVAPTWTRAEAEVWWKDRAPAIKAQRARHVAGPGSKPPTAIFDARRLASPRGTGPGGGTPSGRRRPTA